MGIKQSRSRILFAALIASVMMLVAIVPSYATAGTVYYVSSTGNDTHSGLSQQAPWKTINRVNSTHLNPGDSVLFQGGTTFAGQVYLSPGESGTAANPITISSYGSGVATLDGQNGNAIYAYDAGGIEINHLTLTGSGAATNTGAGINFYNDLAGNSTLNMIGVTTVTASGFRNGLSLGGGNGGSGYSNVSIDHSTFANNQRAGLVTYGPAFNSSNPVYVNHTVYVSNVTAYGNQGDASLTGANDSGNGIVLGSVNGGTLEYSSAYTNGANCKASACGVGIWAYDSTNVIIQHDISYGNKTGSTVDGDGFDLDQNTSNSIMQYNYSYNNDGAGYLLFGASTNQAHTGNTVRFNVSQNDARKNSLGDVVMYGNAGNDAIYNNTLYIAPSSQGGTPTAIRIYGIGNGTTTVRNNIFYASGGLWPVTVLVSPSVATLTFQQNDYYSNANIYWGTTSYPTLAAWRSATGQEVINGQPSGFTVNPGLKNAGNGTLTTSPGALSQLTQYQLASGSPMKNAGINLPQAYGTNIGSMDFYGVTVPSVNGLSVGAAE